MPELRQQLQARSADMLVGLAWGDVTILLPGEAIRDLEHAMDVLPEEGADHVVGRLTKAALTWPVYALNRELQPARSAASGRMVCAMVEVDGVGFGLLCEAVAMHRAYDLSLSPLPPAMKLPASPVSAITRLGEGIALVIDGKRLVDRLGVAGSGIGAGAAS